MKLVLHTDNDSLEISNVILKDNIYPAISGVTFSDDAGDISHEFLEPAIWFKILIMETLSIDCRSQAVYWSAIKVSPELEQESYNEDLSLDDSEYPDDLVRLNEDCIDHLNGLDEVYDTVPHLLSSFRANKISERHFYKSLIELLHVNVLPNIKLTFENLESVKKIQFEYDRTLISLDEQILFKTEMLQNLKKRKKSERHKLLSELISSKRHSYLNDTLVSVLERDFKLDVEKHLPGHFISASSSGEFKDDFKVAYNADNINLALQKLSQSKLKSRFSWLYSSSPVNGELYLKVTETENKMRDQIRGLIDKKMMLRSIIETMKNVSDELQQGFESYGVELNTKSLVGLSNIIGESLHNKSWESLPQRVANLFSNQNHHITKECFMMTNRVCTMIESTLHEYNIRRLHGSQAKRASISGPQVSNGSLEKPFSTHVIFRDLKKCFSHVDLSRSRRYADNLAISTAIGSLSSVRSEKVPLKACFKPATNLSFHQGSSISSGYVFVCNSDPKFVSKTIAKLNDLTTDHFQYLCKQIQNEIGETYNEGNFRKIWIIYENYFYEKTMDGLLELYRTEYSVSTKVLMKSIELFTVEDLELSDSPVSQLLLNQDLSSLGNSSEELNLEVNVDKIRYPSNQALSSSNEGSFIDSQELSYNSLNEADLHLRAACRTRISCTAFIPPNNKCSSTIQLKPWILNRFAKAYENINDALSAKTPVVKTQHLLKCLKNISEQVEKIYKEVWMKQLKLCSDDVVDALIIFICNLKDPTIFEDLYIQVKFLSKFLAEFFSAGVYKFTLVQFLMACQYLQDKAFMKRNRLKSFSKFNQK